MLQRLLNLLPNGDTRKKVEKMVSDTDVHAFMAKPSKDFEPWLQTLPMEPISGLADKCWSWIRSWGNGGGDLSTEQGVQAAIELLDSDSPQALAATIFDNIADFSKSPFEASSLVMLLMDESLQECQAKAGGAGRRGL